MSEQLVQDEHAPVKRRRSLITDATFREMLGGIDTVTLWRLRKRDPRCPQGTTRLPGSNLNMNDADAVDQYVNSVLGEPATKAA